MTDLSKMRQEYGERELDISNIAPDWRSQFELWLSEASASRLLEANAMVLSTVNADSEPSSRTVLLKRADERGFVFFTNYLSRKGHDIAQNPRVSALFGWYALHRQVVIAGQAERISVAESAEYFARRPYGAQLGAHASPQSHIIESRAELLAGRQAAQRAYPEKVPCPKNWGGYRIVPSSVEFWQGRSDRLHDRLRFRFVDQTWVVERLAP